MDGALGQHHPAKQRVAVLVEDQDNPCIPTLGGIRIEDDMVITQDGSRSLTSLPRGLLVVG